MSESSVDRLVAELRRRVEGMRVGERMPSSRALMAEFGVGPVTVQRATSRLVSEGRLTSRPGAGTFVAGRRTTPVPDTDWQHIVLGASPIDRSTVAVLFPSQATESFPLATGYLDESLRPDARIALAMARAAWRPGAWSAPPAGGVPALRSWFAGELGVEANDVLVTPGGQGAVSATLRALVAVGSPVLFEAPTYPGALAVARSAGLVPVPVPTDRDGVRPALLEQAFASSRSRVLYLQPTFANPDGHVLAPHRRAEVLEIAAAAGAFVVEDDWARWLPHGRPSPAPLIRDDHEGRVITINSLTKVLAPSLRVGAVTSRGPVAQRIAAMRLVDDFFVSQPLQEAALELVAGAGWPTHVRTVATALRRRCLAMSQALSRHLPDCTFDQPTGGLHIWLGLPSGAEDGVVAERSLRYGVAVRPGAPYSVGEQPGRHVRLSFAAIDESRIEESVRRLGRAISEAG